MRQGVLFSCFILLCAGCASSAVGPQMTPEAESRLVLDQEACNAKADQVARGFGQGGITWERKRKEIYDYCMKSKGWESK